MCHLPNPSIEATEPETNPSAHSIRGDGAASRSRTGRAPCSDGRKAVRRYLSVSLLVRLTRHTGRWPLTRLSQRAGPADEHCLPLLLSSSAPEALSAALRASASVLTAGPVG